MARSGAAVRALMRAAVLLISVHLGCTRVIRALGLARRFGKGARDVSGSRSDRFKSVNDECL
jgi:hypothetical protein